MDQTTDPTLPTWLELVLLMVHGPGRLTGDDSPEPSVAGTIRSVEAHELPGNDMGWFAFSPRGRPDVTGAGLPDDGTEVRVWRDGERVRVEASDGAPSFITDGATTWEFRDDGVPLASTGRRLSWVGRPGRWGWPRRRTSPSRWRSSSTRLRVWCCSRALRPRVRWTPGSS